MFYKVINNKLIEKQKIKKILIRGTDFIGDSVNTLPAIYNIRNIFPHSYIVLITSKQSKDIYINQKEIDNILIYNIKDNIKKQIDFIKKLRKEKFDLAILFSGSFNAALISFLSNIPYRVGLNTDYRGFLLTTRIYCNEKSQHLVDTYLDIVRSIDNNVEIVSPHIYIKENELLDAKKILYANNIDIENKGLKIIGLVPGASMIEKCWDIKNFVKLALLLGKNFNCKIIFFGSQAETFFEDSIREIVDNTKIINLIGKINLREFISIVSLLDLVISNNSGSMHIASAVGTKVICISGHSNIDMNRPYGDNNIIVSKAYPCQPCSVNKLKKCKDRKCINDITIEEVFEKVKEGLR